MGHCGPRLPRDPFFDSVLFIRALRAIFFVRCPRVKKNEVITSVIKKKVNDKEKGWRICFRSWELAEKSEKNRSFPVPQTAYIVCQASSAISVIFPERKRSRQTVPKVPFYRLSRYQPPTLFSPC